MWAVEEEEEDERHTTNTICRRPRVESIAFNPTKTHESTSATPTTHKPSIQLRRYIPQWQISTPTHPHICTHIYIKCGRNIVCACWLDGASRVLLLLLPLLYPFHYYPPSDIPQLIQTHIHGRVVMRLSMGSVGLWQLLYQSNQTKPPTILVIITEVAHCYFITQDATYADHLYHPSTHSKYTLSHT